MNQERKQPRTIKGDTPLFVCLFLLALFPAPAIRAADSLAILPGNFTLSGPAARQTLLLERGDGKHFTGQVTSLLRVVTIRNTMGFPS